MYEALAGRLWTAADSTVKGNAETTVSRRDAEAASVALRDMETKLQKRDREIDYFRRRTNEVLAENERLAQDLRYITQQMEKDPIGTDGVAVRIPGRANQTDGVICTTVFILRPERDPAAVAAIRAYAAETENQLTRYRLMAWIGETEGPEPKVPTAVDIIADSLEERERRLEAEKFER